MVRPKLGYQKYVDGRVDELGRSLVPFLAKQIKKEIWVLMEKALDIQVEKALDRQYDVLKVLFNVRIT